MSLPQAAVGGALGYGTTGDLEGAMIGALAGGGARSAFSRGIMSPVGQRYLANQSLFNVPLPNPAQRNLVRALGVSMPARQ